MWSHILYTKDFWLFTAIPIAGLKAPDKIPAHSRKPQIWMDQLFFRWFLPQGIKRRNRALTHTAHVLKQSPGVQSMGTEACRCAYACGKVYSLRLIS